MRAHAQPHLHADLPAYISSCHTYSGSFTNWLLTEDVQRLHQVRQPVSFLTRLQVSIFILICTLAAARRSHLNRSCIPGPRQASRIRRTRISDYLPWSRAWVVYFEATVRYHPRLLPHLCSETFCGATPGRALVSSRSGTRDPSPLRGPAP